jgi:hypothetical protein
LTYSLAVRLSADSTALILGGTSAPTPDDVYIEIVTNQYIAPTHPGQRDAGVAADVICLYVKVGQAALDGLYRIAEEKLLAAQRATDDRYHGRD